MGKIIAWGNTHHLSRSGDERMNECDIQNRITQFNIRRTMSILPRSTLAPSANSPSGHARKEVEDFRQRTVAERLVAARLGQVATYSPSLYGGSDRKT